MVPRLFEIFGAKLNFRRVFSLFKVFANLHDLVQVVSLAVDFNGFFEFVCLDIQISCFFPFTRVSLILCLLDQDNRVKQRSAISSILAVFSYQVVSFSKLLQLDVNADSFVEHFVFDVIRSGLLEFALLRQDLTLEPGVVEVVNLVHFLCGFAKLNKVQFPDVGERVARISEFLRKERFDSQLAPLLYGHTDASKLVGHIKVLLV